MEKAHNNAGSLPRASWLQVAIRKPKETEDFLLMFFVKLDQTLKCILVSTCYIVDLKLELISNKALATVINVADVSSRTAHSGYHGLFSAIPTESGGHDDSQQVRIFGINPY